jgi:signal transduction histidine kinase
MEQAPQDRIEQLEKLVATLRHDLRGVVTPAALIADRLRNSSDPTIQRSAARITDVVERILARLNATYDIVPPHGEAGPIVGGAGHSNNSARKS